MGSVIHVPWNPTPKPITIIYYEGLFSYSDTTLNSLMVALIYVNERLLSHIKIDN